MPGLPIRFLPHSAQLAVPAADAWINQIESMSPDAGITLFEEAAGSEYDRAFVAEKEIKPRLPIVTSDVSLLATIGFDSLLISAESDSDGFYAYARELPFGGLPTPIATTDHIVMQCTDGILYPVSLSAGHNTVARLNLMLLGALGSSENSGATPFVWTASQAIPSGAGQTANIYCAGPVQYTVGDADAVLLAGISDIMVNFGLEPLQEGTESVVYPDHVSIIYRAATFEFTTKDPSLIATIADGVALSQFAAYFVQVAGNGQRVDPTTATHIKISATSGIIKPGVTNLRFKTPGTQAYTFTPVLVDSVQITISTTSEIPTS